ncbi:MAG: sortase A [Planctomycetota bacterium]|jgi:sortase A
MFKKTFITLVLILLPLCGMWFIAQGSYIHAKANLAQLLLETAWTETLNGQKEVKPWPWADTWPVSRLSVPRLGISRIVLAGANGSALAFGPGHLFKSATPGERGNIVFAGHRDTHFEFLKDLQIGDALELQTTKAKTLIYEITDTAVVDEDDTEFLASGDEQLLTLITCYPFDAIQPGGRQRYLVIAKYKFSRTYT